MSRQNKVKKIGHRGAPEVYPENTLPSFKEAVEIGADAVEMDIHKTKEDKLVVIHDRKVDRTTDGEGYIDNLTLEQVKELDAGHSFTDDNDDHPYRGDGFEIPTLEEVFQELNGSTEFILEIKTKYVSIDRIVEATEEYGVTDDVRLSSFIDDVLHEVRRDYPDIETSFGIMEAREFLKLPMDELDSYNPPGDYFSTNIDYASTKVLEKTSRYDLDSYVWTVNETDAMKKLIEMGFNGIMTDRPSTLAGLLEGN